MSTSRRTFLTKVSTGLAAPLILGADNKSGSKKPVMGEGDHKYEVTHDWGELPKDIAYGNTHGVCEDKNGHIYIHHTVNATSEKSDSMVVFDHKGKFVKSWGKDFKGGAHGLRIHDEGKQQFLYLCDTKRGLMVKTTLDGEEVMTIGYPKESEPYSKQVDGKPIKYSPTNLAIGPNGDIYIGDGYGSSYINQYDSSGKYIRTFGGKGKETGQLDCPHGITVDYRLKEPNIIVADRTNKRLQRFTLDGKPIDVMDDFPAPCYFGFNKKNGDMVIPDLNAQVMILNKENKVVAHLGDDSATEYRKTRVMSRDHFTPGKFVCPHGACFDHAGNIYVVEWVEVGRVSQLRKVS